MTTEPASGLEDLDLSALEFWALPLEERHGRLRGRCAQREHPAFFAELDDAVRRARARATTPSYRHADVVEASRHPELFCSGPGAPTSATCPTDFLEFFGSMINMDDPRHARHAPDRVRAASRRGSSSRSRTTSRRAAERIVDELSPTGQGDFVTDIAATPAAADHLRHDGHPRRSQETVHLRRHQRHPRLRRPRVRRRTRTATRRRAILTAGAELSQLVTELATSAREATRRDDLTTALVTAEVDGEQLTDAELASFFILLVVAGNETTRNAISHGLQLLTEHPEQRERWLADFDGTHRPARSRRSCAGPRRSSTSGAPSPRTAS